MQDGPLPTAVDYPKSAEPTPQHRLSFEFRGKGSEYFRIWIVNLLLILLTLGIYSAWAKVRQLRYFYGSTRLDGAAFDYHGEPIAILKGRLLAIGVYVAFILLAQVFPPVSIVVLPALVFGLPWIVMRSRTFQMQMTSWRGIRFGFDGTYGGAMGAYVGWAILASITFYLLTPMWHWKRVNYLFANTRFGTEQVRFVTRMEMFWGFWLATVGLSLVLLVPVGIGFTMLAGAGLAGPDSSLASVFSDLGLVVTLTAGFCALGILGYYRKSFINAAWGGIEIHSHRVHSFVQTWPLIRIYVTNFLLMLLTVGLYYPWAKVALARYQVEHTQLEVSGTLDDFRAQLSAESSAIGEEAGEFFDADMGL